MVNKSTNINKTNNYFSHVTMPQHMPRTYSDGIPGPDLGQAQKCGWVAWLIAYSL
jgi:hypothetical protein